MVPANYAVQHLSDPILLSWQALKLRHTTAARMQRTSPPLPYPSALLRRVEKAKRRANLEPRPPGAPGSRPGFGR
jgi:hypothetical protein